MDNEPERHKLMPSAHIEVDYFTNHKVVGMSQAAKLLDIAGILYSAREMRDGILSRTDVLVIAAQIDVIELESCLRELQNAGRWAPVAGGGGIIHDYLDYNDSRAEILREKEANRVRMQLARNAARAMADEPEPEPEPEPPVDNPSGRSRQRKSGGSADISPPRVASIGCAPERSAHVHLNVQCTCLERAANVQSGSSPLRERSRARARSISVGDTPYVLDENVKDVLPAVPTLATPKSGPTALSVATQPTLSQDDPSETIDDPSETRDEDDGLSSSLPTKHSDLESPYRAGAGTGEGARGLSGSEENEKNAANAENECAPAPKRRKKRRAATDEGAESPVLSTDAVDQVYAHYKLWIQPRSKLCPREKITARLQTFSVDELIEGIDHFAADVWWMDHCAHYGGAWFFHSDARSEKFRLLVPRVPARLVPKSDTHSDNRVLYKAVAGRRMPVGWMDGDD